LWLSRRCSGSGRRSARQSGCNRARRRASSIANRWCWRIQNPDLAAPEDGCALLASPRGPAYVAYVDHLFYTAEEAMALDPDWAPVFAEVFRQHTDYLCSAAQDGEGFTVEVLAVVMGISARTCPATPPCG
jgi:hypothetical protein